ncbi:MAG: hypothetical protein ABI778_08305, partial [Ignavibacteriota bacterium]
MTQRLFPLRDGGSLKLTCARAYLPSGRLLQRRYDGATYLNERFRFDSITDNYEHSSEAASVSKAYRPYLTYFGRKVYGGQGVIPDYILPQPMIHQSMQRLLDEQAFVNLAMAYLPAHAAELRDKYSVGSFMAEFHSPKTLISDLERLAKEWRIEIDPKELALD